MSSVIVDARGERQVFNHCGDALHKAHALNTRLLDGVLADPRWDDGAAAAPLWARENDVLGMLDADVAQQAVLQRLVPLAQWAVFSQPGLACFAPTAADIDAALHQALDAGANSAMVTLGERGVAWMHAKQRVLQTQAAFPVKALDTTGAGDVFHAALCFAVSQLKPHASTSQERQAIRFTCAAAALKCTARHGALGAPTRAEVLRFLDAQSTSSNN